MAGPTRRRSCSPASVSATERVVRLKRRRRAALRDRAYAWTERRGRHARRARGRAEAALLGDRDKTFSSDKLARDIDEFLSIPHAIQDALLSALQQPKLHLCSSASKEKQRGKAQTGKQRPGSVGDRPRLHGPELRLRPGDGKAATAIALIRAAVRARRHVLRHRRVPTARSPTRSWSARRSRRFATRS